MSRPRDERYVRSRIACTSCRRKVYRDEAVRYYGTPRGDEAFCFPCRRRLLGQAECGHDRRQAGTREDGTTYCRACEADQEAQRRLDYDERQAERRARRPAAGRARAVRARRRVRTSP
ncbi:MAG: hypothetical protein ACREX3_08295 [Gammaproteobacteria bacterium]